jgi:anti-sigma factor (TIGR02949 family)
MECPEVVDRLWEYLDGELAAKEADAVGRHLAGCPACLPRCRCDRAFLALVVRSLNGPCPAPLRLREAVRARLAAHPDVADFRKR